MILRGGKQLEGSKRGGNGVSLHDEHDKHDEHVVNAENEVSVPPNEVIVDVHKSKEPPKDSNVTSPKPYNPPLSFPQRMAKAKVDLQFEEFFEVLKKLYINITFTEALSEMPSYTKFFKKNLSNKRKLESMKLLH